VRFLRPFVAWLAIFSMLAGAAMTFQFAFGLSKFGGLEYLPRVVSLRFFREIAGGLSFSAALFAWITVTHGDDESAARRQFRSIATTVAVVFFFSELLALSVGLGTSLLFSALVYDLSPHVYWVAMTRTITASDCLSGVAGIATSAVVLLPIGHFLAPRMATLSWGLPQKLVSVWFGLFVLRVLLDIAVDVAA
jgi:phospholipid/cholesterol/gamma-HCH transport system permease protein